jgi:TP901 family phage tail tape measure protein
MADRSISLGVIFTGHIDKQLANAMAKLKSFGTGQVMGTAPGDLERSAKGAKKLADETTIVGKQLSRVSEGMARLTGAFKVVLAYGLAGTAVYQVVDAFRAAKEAVFDYSQTLKNLQAIIGATEEQVGALGAKILEVAARTRYSATEVGDAMVYLGQAGLDTVETLDAIEAVASLAVGTLSDMKTSADLVTTAIRAFGIDSSRSMEIADIFASAVNKSKLTIDKLRTAFNYLAPVAAKAGVSLNEAAAASMVLANSGIRASTIGTGLRQVFARLIAPSEKLREQYAALGINLDELNPATNDLADIIERLTEIVPDAQRAFELFGLRGAPAVAALTLAGREGFEQMLEYTFRVGTAMRMAETQMEGLATMAKNLADKIQVLYIAIGEGGLATAFELLYTAMRGALDYLILFAKNPVGQILIAFTAITTVVTATAAAFIYLRRTMLAWMLGATLKQTKEMVGALGRFNTTMIALQGSATAVRIGMNKFTKTLYSAGAGLAALMKNIYKLSPWVVWISVIAGAAAAFASWNKHIEKTIQRLRQQGNILDASIRKMEGLKEQLEANRHNTIAYQGTIDRITESYEDWGEAIKATEGDLTKLQNVLDMMIDEKVWERLQNISQIMLEAGFWQTYQDAEQAIAGLNTELVLTEKLQKELNKEVPIMGRLMDKHLTQFTDVMSKEARFAIEEMLAGLGLIDKATRKYVADQIQAFLNLHRQVKKSVEDMKVEAAKLPPFILQEFEKMQARGKFPFLQRYRQYLSQTESATKTLLDMWKVSGKEFEDFRDRMEAGFATEASSIADFLSDIAEIKQTGLETDAEINERRLALIQDYLKWLKVFGVTEKKRLDEQLTGARKHFEDLNTERKKWDRGWSEAELEARITKREEMFQRRIKVLELRMQTLKRELEVILKGMTTELSESEIDEMLKIEVKKWNNVGKIALDAYTKQEARHRAHLAKLLLQRRQALDKIAGNEKEEARINKEFDDLSEAASISNQMKLLDIEMKGNRERLEHFELTEELKLKAAQAMGQKEIDTTREIREKQLQLEMDLALKTARARNEAMEQARAAEPAVTETPEWAEQELEYLKDLIRYWTAYNKLKELGTKETTKNLKRYTQEWYEHEKKMLDESNALKEDYWRLDAEMLEHNYDGYMGIFKGIKAGWYRILADMKTTAQQFSDFTIEVFERMNTFVGDVMYAFLKGESIKIKDLFADLMNDILRAWTQMIARMLVQKAVLGFAGAFAGGTADTSGSGAFHSGPVYQTHGGGVIGKDQMPLMPKFHEGGLAKNEVVSVLQKGETVFTPEQMKALKGMGSTLSINVPITIEDPEKSKALQSRMRKNIEATVQKTLREETSL